MSEQSHSHFHSFPTTPGSLQWTRQLYLWRYLPLWWGQPLLWEVLWALLWRSCLLWPHLWWQRGVCTVCPGSGCTFQWRHWNRCFLYWGNVWKSTGKWTAAKWDCSGCAGRAECGVNSVASQLLCRVWLSTDSDYQWDTGCRVWDWRWVQWVCLYQVHLGFIWKHTNCQYVPLCCKHVLYITDQCNRVDKPSVWEYLQILGITYFDHLLQQQSSVQLFILTRLHILPLLSSDIEAVRCETVNDDCVYRFYVAIDAEDQTILPIHVEYEGGKDRMVQTLIVTKPFACTHSPPPHTQPALRPQRVLPHGR